MNTYFFTFENKIKHLFKGFLFWRGKEEEDIVMNEDYKNIQICALFIVIFHFLGHETK